MHGVLIWLQSFSAYSSMHIKFKVNDKVLTQWVVSLITLMSNYLKICLFVYLYDKIPNFSRILTKIR